MAWNNILVDFDNEIAVVSINRPKALNALDHQTIAELGEAMAELAANQSVKVIILTGAGEKAFVAGADIAYMLSLTPMQAQEFSRHGQKVFSQIENMPKPVIAAVNGFALGGGCELSMACDIRVASEKAKFGQPEVSLGIMAGFGGTQRLARLVNPGVAKEILFTGDIYDAQAALRFGLVSKVVPADELMDVCKKMAKRIASMGPVGVRFTKEAINQGLDMDQEKAFNIEADLFGVIFSTADQKEGMSAFLEKRKVEFKGE
ncbi:enoyl-CoA hydratase-related protein [Pelotomaculum terephthalicicum JT]|uniref:enoyl-CoA hydratase-related protein n=1 Tax=Pelotomaculum TaxID=191373 RepID=UPI0009D4020E|nr:MULTISPECIES: enoyl-CoA hydratase-related protein [Pelotomaculum]MCG9966508.1 enoyl-CoA hydratase-related protein [Pelotomaculum terephthalicicum JT]OPX86006.1 MAG: putative enoyl-CoA hydratase echA8 [Pelotomaculum sp. PtaB.Bin117]OPY60692.1 MAG: putative enoyl-CoA hydratase echA8 [Pelotomaculum sp. PtaU1.Bin065]